jgi:hypothetical protein
MGVYRGIMNKIIYVIVYSEMLGGIPRKNDLVGHLRCFGNEEEKRDRLHY